MSFRLIGLISLLSATLTLSACESSEERAQKHYESAVALLEKGDVSRAMVELRNAFKLNPRHQEARRTFARTKLENDEVSLAYRQYLRLIEFYPDDFEARVALAEISILAQDWENAERHGRAAADLTADDPGVKVIVAVLDYADARRKSDAPLAEQNAQFLIEALDADPSNRVARRVVVEYLINAGSFEEALPEVEEGLIYEPDSYQFLMTKLRLLVQAENKSGVESTLKLMMSKFPDDQELQQMLISWYLQEENLDGAEAFLRELAAAPDAGTAEKMTVIRFVREVHGEEAARAELNAMIETEENPLVFQALLSAMDFEAGNQTQAIADLEALLADAPKGEATSNAKTALAQMLIATGNPVGARVRVEEVLADDAGHVAALKMLAGWLIEEDKPGDAIIALRTALPGAPQDADIMTLMGQAHERAGARELAGERYAKAVEISGAAPVESLRYASFLIGDGRVEAAEAVLQEALNKTPTNTSLLRSMAGIYIGKQDWNRTTRIIWSLRAQDTPEATATANGIEAEMLLRQQRTDETIAFLKNLVDENEDDAAAISALIETQVNNGELEAATEIIEQRIAEKPEDDTLKFLRAGLYFLSDDHENAEAIYKSLLEKHPDSSRILRTYYSLLIANDRDEEAGEMVDRIVAEHPDATGARFLKAERLERDLDFEGAIAIYEALYAENTGNIILANNLASLITTHRDDQESLDRAFAIASRLKGTNSPPLQDTYGWIEYRRGNFDEAVKYLEPAAQGLQNDPLVQYHLGLAYRALDRKEDAKAALGRALDVGQDIPLSQLDHAREVLAELEKTE